MFSNSIDYFPLVFKKEKYKQFINSYLSFCSGGASDEELDRFYRSSFVEYPDICLEWFAFNWVARARTQKKLSKKKLPEVYELAYNLTCNEISLISRETCEQFIELAKIKYPELID